MALRKIQTGMVSRYANLQNNDTTLFGNLSVVGTVSAANIVGGIGAVNSFYPYQAFDTDGVVTTFSLLCAAPSVNDILVFVSGVYQNKSLYFLSNNYTLNLYTPPPSGSQMLEVAFVRGGAYSFSTYVPADNSVITSKIADGAVIGSKIRDGSVATEKLCAAFVTIPVQVLSGTGSQTQFSIASAVANPNDINVFISGVYQNKDSYYILPSPYHVTFSEAPPSGSRIEINYLRSIPSTTFIPADFSVTTSQIVDNAVTTAKLADGAVTSEKLANDIIIDGNLTVFGNLTALGTSTQINTNISTTSALSVINVGSGPALVVRQTGPEPIAEFFDNESGPALWLANNGLVGVGTDTPTSTLTVAGTLSARGGLSALNIRTEQITVSTGTVTAPSIANITERNTGIYFPAPNTIAIVINGTEQLRLNSSGSIIAGQPQTMSGTISAFDVLTTMIIGARGGGSDRLFWENDSNMNTDYTITSGKNAMTAGPITINTGATLTVLSGSTWTVV